MWKKRVFLIIESLTINVDYWKVRYQRRILRLETFSPAVENAILEMPLDVVNVLT